MREKQATIKKPVSVEGIGLHTGQKVTMTFHPAPPDHGYKFQRVDLPDKPIIKADIDNVVDVSRGTTIEVDGVRITTVEHTLAALAGLEIDNVLIELNGPEPPVMDGSSKVYIDTLLKAGIKEQDAERHYLSINTNICYNEEGRNVELIAMPSDTYQLSVVIDYNSPVLGTQRASISNISEFRDEIAASRTFSFLHELEELAANNLIKGGNLDNAIVVVDKVIKEKEIENLSNLLNLTKIKIPHQGILNGKKLHHKNEPARHKLLDVVGDLALIGMPIKAHIIATKPGHKANIAFAKEIKKYIKENRMLLDKPIYDPDKKPALDINEVAKFLPHKYPFLLIDKVSEISDKHVVAIKNVTANEGYFQGHFPNNPVMPGVLQIEAMAQAGGILLMRSIPDPDNYIPYFLKIEKAKFKYKVVPGDTLILKVELINPVRRLIFEIKGTAYVGNKIVAEAILMARAIKKEDQQI